MNSHTITSIIQKTASQMPNHTALIDDSRSCTYGQLWEEVERRAAALNEYGIQRGMGVGVLGQNSLEFVASALAVMEVGAVMVPISHNLKVDEIHRLCQRTGVHVIWDDGTTALPAFTQDSTSVCEWRMSVNDDAKATTLLIPEVEGAAFIRFTSGTTGKSKGVVLSHQSIIERTESANARLQLGPDDTVMWVLSMAYHFVVSILMYLRYGCAICVCESFMGDYIVSRTNEVGGTFLYVSPMHVRMFNRLPEGTTLPTLKRIISTSMAIDAKLCTDFYEKFNLPITQAFGIIEIGLPVINTRAPHSEPAAIGFPLEAYDVTILDEMGAEVDVDVVGQLAIRGPGMFDAYMDPYLSREEAMEFGYFLTGDLARCDAEGRVTIAGRKKNVINVSGNKAFPEEIEHIINQYPGVIRSRVKGFKHPLLRECPMAEVVIQDGVTLDVEALISFCRKRLSTYKVPQRVVIVESLAMTDSGKIART